jgi:hypothetical protein
MAGRAGEWGALAAVHVELAIVDGLIEEELAVADLDVVAAVGVRADPGFEVDRRALAPEIRERNEISIVTLTTLRKLIHPPHPLMHEGG